MNGAAPQLTYSIDSIFEDKELMKMQVDLQKTFPDIPCVSQMLGGRSLRRGDTKKCLNIPSGTGRGGNDTGLLVTWEFSLRIQHTENPWSHSRNNFILQFLYLACKFQDCVLILDQSSSRNSVEGGTLKLL